MKQLIKTRLNIAIAIEFGMVLGMIITVVFTAIRQGDAPIGPVYIHELIITALILLCAIKAIVDRRVGTTIPKTAFPIAALILLGLIQSIEFKGSDGRRWSLSMDVEATRSAVTALFFLLISFLIASNFFSSRQRLYGLANFLVIYGLAMAAFALAQQCLHQTVDYEGVHGPFANRNHFAGYMEMLTPIPAALIVTRGIHRKAQLLYGLAAAVMGVAVIGSLSRGGMACLTAEMVFVLGMSMWLSKRNRPGGEGTRLRLSGKQVQIFPSRAGVVVAIAIAITLGSLSIGAGPVTRRVTKTIRQMRSANPEADFTEGRKPIWRDTLAMIRANPLLGVGLGAYKTAYPIYSNGSTPVYGQSHNDYLQVLADCGVVGGFIAAWFLVSVIHTIAQSVRAHDRLLLGLAIGSAAAIMGILIHSLVDFNLQLPPNALLFLLLLAVTTHIASGVRKMENSGQRAA